MTIAATDNLTEQLDALETECMQLVALLRDRHEGLMTWRHIVGGHAKTIATMMVDLGMVKADDL